MYNVNLYHFKRCIIHFVNTVIDTISFITFYLVINILESQLNYQLFLFYSEIYFVIRITKIHLFTETSKKYGVRKIFYISFFYITRMILTYLS